jgi:hypothetical protein
MEQIVEKRGRPALSPEQREERYLMRLAKQREYQAKVRAENPEHLKLINKACRDRNKEEYNARMRIANRKYRAKVKAQKEVLNRIVVV